MRIKTNIERGLDAYRSAWKLHKIARKYNLSRPRPRIDEYMEDYGCFHVEMSKRRNIAHLVYPFLKERVGELDEKWTTAAKGLWFDLEADANYVRFYLGV